MKKNVDFNCELMLQNLKNEFDKKESQLNLEIKILKSQLEEQKNINLSTK